VKKVIVIIWMLVLLCCALLYTVNANDRREEAGKGTDQLVRQMMFMRTDPVMYRVFMEKKHECIEDLLTEYGY